MACVNGLKLKETIFRSQVTYHLFQEALPDLPRAD